MNAAAFDVLYIGNYTKDTILSPAGRRHVDGGGSLYASYAAARLGKRVALVTRLAKEDAHVIQALEKAGVACFQTYSAQSTLMQLEYPTTDPDLRSLTVAATAGSIAADDVDSLGARSAAIVTSLRGEVGLDVICELKERGMTLAADVQGFVRVLDGQQLENQPWPEMQTALHYIDIVKSDAVEAEFLTGESDIFRAARSYAAMGPREIVLTHKDGLLLLADGEFTELGFYPESLEGRSGRGDTCIGTYVAVRQEKPPREAAIWAAAVTSLKMGKLGPFDRSLDDVEVLIQARYRDKAPQTNRHWNAINEA